MKKQELLDYLDEKLMEKLFAFSYARTNDSHEAQELCSDIVCALVEAARTQGEVTKLYPFIWRVARNVYVDFLRDKKRRQTFLCEGDPEGEVPLISPGEEDVSRELLEAVYRRIAFLTKTYREVMILYYLDGLSAVEIAELLKIKETTVRQRLLWARYKVKCEVKKEGDTCGRARTPDKMKYVVYGSGDSSWGDPRDLSERTLSGHVIWLCRKKPMCAAEIAQELNVPTVYIEEELETLANGKNGIYGLLRRRGNDRYEINFILLDRAAVKKARQLYLEQMPKICRTVIDYVKRHRAEYLGFPYLNGGSARREPDFNLVLWQQLAVISRAFPGHVERILGERYFAEYEEPKRPYHVFGHVDIGGKCGMEWESTCGEDMCGYKSVRVDNIGFSYVRRHFAAGHNLSVDPLLQTALRAVRGLRVSALAEDEREHAAKAVECGYLHREGDILYTKILVNSMKDDPRLFEISGRLSREYFEEEAQETAARMAALIRKAVPGHLLGEWRYANRLAGMPIPDRMAEALIGEGILVPPVGGIGAEGCWMSVL